MKRISKLALVLAVVAALASCEKGNQISGSKEVPGGQSETLGNTEIVASFEDTKASYAEEGTGLRPSWEVGDVVIAIGDGKYAGETSKFTVKSVNPDGSANLQGNAPSDCTLHLVYCPDAAQGTEIPVDYTAQTGAQKTMPAVMLSDGEVKDCKGEFKFRNAGAIIGISAVKGVPSGATISKITVEGANLSAATVTLDGSTLKLNATQKTTDAISTAALNGITVTDDKGTLSSPVLIAVPVGAKITKVSLPVTKEPETMKIPSTDAEKKDIDYVEIEAKYDGTNLSTKKWAKWNVGANSEKDYGWYFPWGGTEGYVWYAGSWQLAGAKSVEFSYTLSSAYTVSASDYVYVKTQSFTTTGHSFDWAHAPFNNCGSSYDATYFSSVRNTVCPDDILALDYDAARANWGGSWRMPKFTDFHALYYACGGESTPKSGGSTSTTDKGVYWCISYDGVAGLLFVDGSGNKLFFPAAGSGDGTYFRDAGSCGRYWSNSLYSSEPDYACLLYFFSSYVSSLYSYNTRRNGFSVRPVSD